MRRSPIFIFPTSPITQKLYVIGKGLKMQRAAPAYLDITLNISPRSAVFPGDPPVVIQPFSHVEESGCCSSEMRFSLHTGTHLDAPLHVLKGAAGVDQISLDVLIGAAQVFSFEGGKRGIDERVLSACWVDGTERALFKTGSSRSLREEQFSEDFSYLEPEAAKFLIKSGVKLVGIDSISVDALAAADLPVHRLLLEAGIVIVEALALEDVPSGAYELICLPIKVEADGAPVRAVLVDRDG